MSETELPESDCPQEVGPKVQPLEVTDEQVAEQIALIQSNLSRQQAWTGYRVLGSSVVLLVLFSWAAAQLA